MFNGTNSSLEVPWTEKKQQKWVQELTEKKNYFDKKQNITKDYQTNLANTWTLTHDASVVVKQLCQTNPHDKQHKILWVREILRSPQRSLQARKVPADTWSQS